MNDCSGFWAFCMLLRCAQQLPHALLAYAMHGTHRKMKDVVQQAQALSKVSRGNACTTAEDPVLQFDVDLPVES